MRVIHEEKAVRFYKTAGVDHEANTTVALCTCERFGVYLAGNREAEARKHLELHLKRHGAGTITEDA